MLRSLAILSSYAWLAIPASADTEDPPSAAPLAEPAPAAAAQPSPGEAPAETTDAAAPAQPVKEVTIDPTAKPPVCKRYVPTGSRIATERCQSAEVDDDARTAERDQTRRDIDEMRTRQAARDQARAAAQAEALRMRAGF
jgi:hypothetical protein